MISLPSGYAAHLAGETTTLGYLLKVTRVDGYTIGLTSAGESLTLSGVLYDATEGLTISSLDTSAGLSVDNMELSSIDDGTVFSRESVLGGLWQNAAFVISRYNWANPSDGTEPLMAGTFGQVGLREGMVVAELRGLQQYLQQPVGNVTTRTCRARFADYPTPNANNLCRLTAATYIRTGTVSAVASRQVFTAATLWGSVSVVDYYGEGFLTWTSGPNVGMSAKVKTYVTGGVITLMQQAISAIAVGHTFSVIAGCRKRAAEDCKTKFNNLLNFQGEPHLPGVDALTSNPSANL